jgi:hypothetical protein
MFVVRMRILFVALFGLHILPSLECHLPGLTSILNTATSLVYPGVAGRSRKIFHPFIAHRRDGVLCHQEIPFRLGLKGELFRAGRFT